MSRVTVVGLGPAGPDLLTAATLAAIERIPTRFLRTGRHPAAEAVPAAATFDAIYERAATIDEVYDAIVEALVAAAVARGEVLYAVPGSPAVAERTVEVLRAQTRVDVDLLPALSCIDLAWARLGVDPLTSGPRIVDGHRFETEAAGQTGPMLVLQCDHRHVLGEIKLAVDDGPEVVVLHHLGLPDEQITTVPWVDLDRVEVDHLTSLWIPALRTPVASELVGFDDLVRLLRERCPWDRAQTHESLRPYVIEEAYEVVDAIEAGDLEHLEEELGDLLFQVVFHARLATEAGEFTLADVARGIHDKLVRRHPHVFQPTGVTEDWETIKQREHPRTELMDGIPAGLPALAYAEKVQRRAASVGFDWDSVDGAWPKVTEEIAELRAAPPDEHEHELGDLLFACVNVARHLGVDAEVALRAATGRFRARFEVVRRLAAERGLPLLDDGLWEEAKRIS